MVVVVVVCERDRSLSRWMTGKKRNSARQKMEDVDEQAEAR